MEFESEIFTTKASTYVKQVILMNMAWALTTIAAILVVLVCLSFYDLRWIFVGLIVVFLSAPMLIFNAYFFYLLNPEAVRALSPKKVTLERNGNIRIEYFRKDNEGELISIEKNEIIPSTSISGFTMKDEIILVKLKHSKTGFLVIPKTSISEDAINLLNDKIKKDLLDS